MLSIAFFNPEFKALDWLMMGMMSIVILQSFVGYYLLSLAWDRFELSAITPVLIEQFRAARFVYLPLYILAALAATTFVASLIHRFGSGAVALSTRLSIIFALFLALLPGLSDRAGAGYIIIVAIFFILAAIVALKWESLPVVLKNVFNPTVGRTLFYAASFIILPGLLFGPLATLFEPISPVPTNNLLDPASRTPTPPWSDSDNEFYIWVRESTEPDTLFYWCGFGPSTTLRFRREAQRGITHNWKDLGWAAYNGTTLVPLLERYRKLEQACEDTNQTVAVAYEIGADYIFVPTAKATELQAASCFANDRYIVFGLGDHACE